MSGFDAAGWRLWRRTRYSCQAALAGADGEADDDHVGVRLVMTLIATWITIGLLVVVGSLALVALLAVVLTLQGFD